MTQNHPNNPAGTLWGMVDTHPAPSNRTTTSKAAAAAIEPHRQTQREKVQAFVESRGRLGATRNEIVAGTGLLLQSVCGRVAELLGEDWRLLVESGEERGTPGGKVLVSRRVVNQ